MTGLQWLWILAQAIAIIALAIGFCHEQQIVRWEQKQINKLKRGLRRMLKNWLETTLPETDSTPETVKPKQKIDWR